MSTDRQPPAEYYRDLADASVMLGHPSRQRILSALLSSGTASLAGLRGAGTQLLSHLRVLERLGVVEPAAGTPRAYRINARRYAQLAGVLRAIVPDVRAAA